MLRLHFKNFFQVKVTEKFKVYSVLNNEYVMCIVQRTYVFTTYHILEAKQSITLSGTKDLIYLEQAHHIVRYMLQDKKQHVTLINNAKLVIFIYYDDRGTIPYGYIYGTRVHVFSETGINYE